VNGLFTNVIAWEGKGERKKEAKGNQNQTGRIKPVHWGKEAGEKNYIGEMYMCLTVQFTLGFIMDYSK
jgi:hypothetical protein